jgi:hypothetical protein
MKTGNASKREDEDAARRTCSSAAEVSRHSRQSGVCQTIGGTVHMSR